MNKKILYTLLVLLITVSTPLYAQVLLDDFNRTNSTTVGNGWSETESITNGAEISSNELRMNSQNISDRVVVMRDISSMMKPKLAEANSIMTWGINMRQNQPDPQGFDINQRGIAFILGKTDNVPSTGDGYAVAIGNSGTATTIRLVRFNSGVTLNSDFTDIITSSTINGDEYVSAKVTFNPTNNQWSLYAETSASGFPASDPTAINTLIGQNADATYINSDLKYIGMLYNHFNTASDFAIFDDVHMPVSEPEIALKGNGVIITNGDVTPTYNDSTRYGDLPLGMTSTHTFRIVNSGTSTLTLSGSPAVSIGGTNAGDFIVTSQPTSSIAPGDSTSFNIMFQPTVEGTRNAVVSIINNDGNENPYTFMVEGKGGPSALSDIIDDGGASFYENNIEYHKYLGNPITNVNNSVGVFRFRVRDGDGSTDTDPVPTILSGIEFNVANAGNIQAAALFSGNTFVAQGSIAGSLIVFSGLPQNVYTITPDDQSTTLTLRVSFKSNPGEVKDRDQLQFTITSTTTPTDGSSSKFAQSNAGGAFSSADNDRNKIEVTATRLNFSSTLVDVSQNQNFNVFIEAVDSIGNKDADANGGVTLSKVVGSGTSVLSGTTSKNLTLGNALFTNLSFNNAETGVRLRVNATGLTADTSNFFNVVGATYVPGDYMAIGDGTWLGTSTALWQRYHPDSSGGWYASSEPPFNSTNNIFIGENFDVVSDGTFQVKRIVVLNGATFTVADNSGTEQVDLKGGEFLVNNGVQHTFEIINIENEGVLNMLSADAVVNGATSSNFTIESGGTLILDNSSLSSSSSIWDGFERFRSGSTVLVKNFDFNNSRLFNGQISANSNGYVFGNLTIDGTPGNEFVLVNGSTPSLNLAQNDLTIINGSAVNYVVLTNADPLLTIGGSVRLLSNGFAMSSSNLSPEFVVKGNIEVSGGVLDLNPIQTAGNTVTVNLEGDLIVTAGSLASSDDGTKIIFNGLDSQNIDVRVPVTDNIYLEVDDNSYVQLLNTLDLPSNATVNVASGGVFNFNFFNVIGTGTFLTQATGHIMITSPDGIETSGAIGNVHTNFRTFNPAAYYEYIGNTNQVTGSALPTASSAKRLIVDMAYDSLMLNLTNSIEIVSPGGLIIEHGTLVEDGSPNVTGNGFFSMTGGRYQISTADANITLPRISGTYTLTGGTVALTGISNSPSTVQSLRGGVTYHTLYIGGSSSNGGYKTINTTATVVNNLSIEGSTIFDIQDKTLAGPATLTMTDGRFRISKVSFTVPELTGSYTLTGGTIELYGSTSSQQQILRGGRVYNNLELNAAAKNSRSGQANVMTGANFTLNGTMQVFAPASYQINTPFNIVGPGSFVLDSGAMLKYGAANGLTNTTAAGNIRTTNKSFSEGADYAIVGTGNMVTGAALPQRVRSLTIDMSSPANIVTLTNPITLADSLSFLTYGRVALGANDMVFAPGATLNGQTTEKYVITDNDVNAQGEVIRQVTGDNTEIIFPVGTASGYSPAVITNASGNATNFSVRVIEDIYTNGDSGPLMPSAETDRFVQRTWFAIPENDSAAMDAVVDLLWKRQAEGPDYQESGSYIARNTLEGGTYQGLPSSAVTAGDSLKSITAQNIAQFGAFAVGGGTSTLPIKLLSFTGKRENGVNILNWTAMSDEDAVGFNIERSSDGRTFSKIGFVSIGERTFGLIDNFSFKDKEVRGSAFYRLHIVNDEVEEYSEIIYLEADGANSPEFVLFPVPVSDRSQLRVDGADPASIYNMSIISSSGQNLWSNTSTVADANSRLGSVFNTLKPGTFILLIRSNSGEAQSIRFVK